MTSLQQTDGRADDVRFTEGSPVVPVRPMDFEKYVADLPKYFAAGGDIAMSHVLTVLSSTFPEGEKFFVRSVAAARDQITDPKLLADVDGFIGQEEMHGREHQVLNERLAEYGYPTRGIDAYVRGLYWVRERIQSKKVNLAFTAALEHYTATLAELLLTDDEARKAVGKPGARDILTWHALEESEHKAVAFDVYKAVGGGEAMRIIVMFLTDLLFILETSIMGVVSVAMDRDARRHPLQLLRSLARLPKSPFLSMRALRILSVYHRPGFHPNDRDTRQLIAEWREALFGREGQLTGLVAG
ncbi:MAG TPA: metal-dependent hydrolase [Mycobacteriales bacterium]|nr:metal-dependent hydrolase [Mycobacteriales bacterium]